MSGDLLALGAVGLLAGAAAWGRRSDRLVGGLADDADRSRFDPRELAMGRRVERQHVGSDVGLAEQIASDHLTEIPDYYSRLARMQQQAKRGGRNAPPERPWLSLALVQACLPEIERRGLSEVARSRRGFLPAFARAGGDPARLGLTPASTPNRAPYPWRQRRNEFVARHMGQVQSRGEPLWLRDGSPSNRHLILVAWAYSPEPERLWAWVRW